MLTEASSFGFTSMWYRCMITLYINLRISLGLCILTQKSGKILELILVFKLSITCFFCSNVRLHRRGRINEVVSGKEKFYFLLRSLLHFTEHIYYTTALKRFFVCFSMTHTHVILVPQRPKQEDLGESEMILDCVLLPGRSGLQQESQNQQSGNGTYFLPYWKP